jgi:membrane-bound serine protease (ClpP class)
MLARIVVSLLLLCSSSVKSEEQVSEILVEKILTLTIDSSINPATYSFLVSAYEKAEQESLDLIVIKLNTPGGLVSTTKKILTLLGKSSIPTVVWITPEGASATSAGAIIASGAHFLFMANGTNIGAATPVQMSSEKISSDMRSKAINDLVALVSSLSQARGRNAELFSKMVKEAASFTSNAALSKKLIDEIVNNKVDLLNYIANKSLLIKGKEYKVVVSDNVTWQDFEMDSGQKLLNIFADPSMAYVLFVLGAALLYLEFQMGGGIIVAGALGVIFLLLAGIGFQVLPLNFGALGLMVLAFILFLLEAFVPSYGLLSLAGIGSLVSGSLFLFRTDDTYMSISVDLIVATCVSIFLFLLFLGLFIYFDRKKNKAKDNHYTLVGKTAEVIEVGDVSANKIFYRVRVDGELWNAYSKSSYKVGEKVVVKSESKDDMVVGI